MICKLIRGFNYKYYKLQTLLTTTQISFLAEYIDIDLVSICLKQEIQYCNGFREIKKILDDSKNNLWDLL